LADEEFPPMRLVTLKEYREFVRKNKSVLIENVDVAVGEKWKIKSLAPPKDYEPERTTVWSFPDRGDWATHVGNYRGNWSPYIPRNLIMKYTEEDDLVLDQMMGSGTTLVECKLLGRKAVGVDVNLDAIMVARDRLNFKVRPLDPEFKEPRIRTYVGDARCLSKVKDESVDLIATHPPYAGIIKYSGRRVEGDVSALKMDGFLGAMKRIAEESLRVLKPNRYCAVLIGDTRKHRHYIPISVRVLEKFLEVGFVLKEDIIKLQHKMLTTRTRWRGKSYDFYLIGHEHLYVLRKGSENERVAKHKLSRRWHSPARAP
jgi:DNA modification methylase